MPLATKSAMSLIAAFGLAVGYVHYAQQRKHQSETLAEKRYAVAMHREIETCKTAKLDRVFGQARMGDQSALSKELGRDFMGRFIDVVERGCLQDERINPYRISPDEYHAMNDEMTAAYGQNVFTTATFDTPVKIIVPDYFVFPAVR